MSRTTSPYMSVLALHYPDPNQPPVPVSALFLSREGGGLFLNFRVPGGTVVRVEFSALQADFLASFLGVFQGPPIPAVAPHDPALAACRALNLWVAENSDRLASEIGGTYESDFLSQAIDLSRAALKGAVASTASWKLA